MAKTLDFIVGGYAGVDRIIRVTQLPAPGVTAIVQNPDNRRLYFGGNASNVACGLAKLGCHVAPLVRVGEDWVTNGYRELFQSLGASLAGVQVVQGEATSICHLVQDDEKCHLTMTYPGAMDIKYARPYPDELFRTARYGVLTVGTGADTRHFLDGCRKNGLPLVFGMRADFESFPKDILWEILTSAEVIFANEVERDILCELYGLESLTQLFEKGPVRHLVVTLGRHGSTVWARTSAGFAEHFADVTAEACCVDATGCGDAYIAGYLYGYQRDETPAACAAYGSTAASFVIERQGCLTNAPGLAQMLERNGRRPDQKP